MGYAFVVLFIGIALHSYYNYVHLPKIHFQKASQQQYDAIIVPGLPYDEGEWSLFLKWRIHWSTFLYHQGITKNIIYSGSVVHTPFIEANVMKAFGTKLGVPEAAMYTETKAEHSSENLYYSILLARDRGFKKLALATDPFQSDMIDDFIERYQLNVDLIPIVYGIGDTINMYEPAIDYPSLKVADFIPLEERENFSERINGTRGHNVDWNSLAN